MPEEPGKPPTVVELVWEHDLVLAGTSGASMMTLDSSGEAGPSPVQALGFALAGCMAMDLVHMLKKGRHDLRGLRTDLKGFRAPEVPHRFTRVEMHFVVRGPIAPEHVERAIELSRAKYCSVWHSLRQDIPLETSFSIAPSE